MAEAVTLTLAEAAVIEDAANEALVDQGFVPSPPITGPVAPYEAGPAFAKGALVEEAGQVYRSQVAANKGHKPSEDADFAFWAPVSVSRVPLVNPAFGGTSYVRG